ncbi:MAG: nucleoside triphosphate pyrophosphohydrolase [Cycloclasticus sp. symbiont of Poecilosclerida sp. M]|nr:MAG: nucleoside triphosphate pyrophosphohydrolase [Cycloclasticus sp. symbiont of Poecilosclerida sp. M]
MDERANNMDKLLQIMRALRDKETGCPWDIKQDFKTIAPYTLEEAYEVVDAIERDDMEQLQDELGDVLFQVVYHTQMAEEKGAFDFTDVLQGICEKLIRRHPHVFKGEQIEEKDLAKEWEKHKKSERNEKESEAPIKNSLLEDVTLAIPAMRRAYKLQIKAASVGFDWQEVAPVVEKLDEEISELKEQLARANNQRRVEEELGDVLFSCVNIARHIGVDAEGALRGANQRFFERFSYIEEQLRKNNKTLEACDVEEMERLWLEAKRCW